MDEDVKQALGELAQRVSLLEAATAPKTVEAVVTPAHEAACASCTGQHGTHRAWCPNAPKPSMKPHFTTQDTPAA